MFSYLLYKLFFLKPQGMEIRVSRPADGYFRSQSIVSGYESAMNQQLSLSSFEKYKAKRALQHY